MLAPSILSRFKGLPDQDGDIINNIKKDIDFMDGDIRALWDAVAKADEELHQIDSERVRMASFVTPSATLKRTVEDSTGGDHDSSGNADESDDDSELTTALAKRIRDNTTAPQNEVAVCLTYDEAQDLLTDDENTQNCEPV